MSTGQKLKIKDLKYLVMEGGGGKGSVYKGAVIAMEELIAKRSDAEKIENLVGRKPAILDYYLNGDENKNSIIEGVAGASAGAITTFALALGLNSDEIEQVLKYDFDNFLKDVDVGKYRMINEKGELAIGEDEKNDQTSQKEMIESDSFQFSFDKAETKIGNNTAKKIKNDLILTAVFKVISDGVASNLSFIEKWITNLFKDIKTDVTPPFFKKLLTWMFQPKNNLIARLGIAGTLHLFVFKIILPKKAKVPIKITGESAMAMIYDRGMFSGFAVREFFMDMVVYAATRNTAFYRGLINYFENETVTNREGLFGNLAGFITVSDIKLLLNYKDSFDISDRNRRVNSKIGENDDLENVLKLLSNLTFKQMYEITKVDFGLSVTNYTSGMPLYFGNEWTPDFRVMEAVGASMSIPPAIKPLYNEADVVKVKNGELPYRVSYQIFNNETNQFESKEGEFIRNDKTFDVKDYYFYEHIVKMGLAQEMGEEGKYIDVNNAIELNSFMKKLKELVIGKINDETSLFTSADINKKTPLEQKVNGRFYTLDYALYKFFYNAQFKGLLLDGGYRNNIPYNFFREKGDKNKLDNVLALKLDGSFPEYLMEKVYIHAKKYIKIENLLSKLDYDLEDLTVRRLLNMLDTERLKIRTQVEIIFGNELALDVIKLVDEKDKKERKRINNQIKRNNDVIDRLTDESIANYKKRMQSAPWKQPKSILNIAFEGYAYGSEMGQVKDVSDHSHIIPLYSYGIGTYDFKMDKMKPLVALAQSKAEEKVKEFFK